MRAPHFPMGHRSWTVTEEVLITQPGLDDIFFFFFFCQKCLSVSYRDFSADSGTPFLLVISPLQLVTAAEDATSKKP